ncbi:hypothetical protein PLICRDRAFT_40744 [Plicaturopsis crispa FD-325 SS-3]|nr:hypothetical protein PLICRDRAFT_40744 [Plicaturopsis crispa FD-325 SS-3]
MGQSSDGHDKRTAVCCPLPSSRRYSSASRAHLAMDLVLHIADDLFLDRVWVHLVPLSAFSSTLASPQSAGVNISDFVIAPGKWSQIVSSLPHPALPTKFASSALVSAWPRDYIPRQIASLFTLTWAGIIVLYFLSAGFSYQCLFNHDMMRHPRFLKNQVKQEIQASLAAFPVMTLLHMPIFEAEVLGYSRLYDSVDERGWLYLLFTIPAFLFFTDIGIYFIHRGLHHPLLYKTLHKPHHKWLVPTPFASYAFHPMDGFAQSIPYHLFAFLFPMHRILYLVLFVLVNFWTIFIHDSDMITDHPLEKIINGPAHHTLHHLYFTVNYGQYFTLADRLGNSYRQPDASLDPLLEVKRLDGASKKSQ